MTTLRRQARSYALQMLYRLEVQPEGGGDPAAEGTARERFWADSRASRKARAMADEWVELVVAHREEIETALNAVLEQWKLTRLPVMVRVVLRLAACELVVQGTEPPSAIINEAMELTRTYMDEASVKFVNSVLDRLHRRREGLPEPGPGGDTLPPPPGGEAPA